MQTHTIGSAVVFTFAVGLSDTGGNTIYENLILTDTLPVGLGYISSVITVTSDADGSDVGPNTSVINTPDTLPSIITSPSSNPSGEMVWDLGDLPGAVIITGVVTATVQNIAANQQGVRLTNELDMSYTDDGRDYTFNDSADVDILEPTLVIEKSVSPVEAAAGTTLFYEITLYHSASSTVPAYNVNITDVIPAGLNYISGSWEQFAGPQALSPLPDDSNLPELIAGWSVIPTTTVQSAPIRLRYNLVVPPGTAPGTLFPNTITSTWTSLPDDPFDETRTGSGGINDYETSDSAQVAISSAQIDKTGPLTVTAGSEISYTLTVFNEGPNTALKAVVTDTMPFQVDTTAATFVVPGTSSGICSITIFPTGDIVVCDIGDIPASITAEMIITGTVKADTPEAADLTNSADFVLTTPEGKKITGTKKVDTEVLTTSDVGVIKTGPSDVTAGETVSYTIVLSNTGPSVSRDVDVKDLLPPGFTYESGSSTQGTCVSGICQLGDVGVGDTITMVITATAGSDISGNVTNKAEYFGDTSDPNPNNDSDTAQTTVNPLTALIIDKIDLTDPVYAGNTYLYEIVITNTGPSDAQNVVVTDTLPVTGQLRRRPAPNARTMVRPPDGTVTCSLGTLAAGASRDYLINVRVASNVVSGTVGTNTTGVTTTTPIDLPNSKLTDTELTTYLQTIGSPTDLSLTKSALPVSVVAGNGRFTYTLTATNNGPAPATAVQVIDAFPSEFDFISATTSDGSTCNGGVTCDLGDMANGDSVVITVVVDVPSDVAAGTYTNTAYIGSASPDSNPNNNKAEADTDVTTLANLNIDKLAKPVLAIPGEELTYTIIATNNGPSDAEDVTVSDVLPAEFTAIVISSSQGGCNALPCNLGTLSAGENALITIQGMVDADATGLQNTASVTSITPGSDDSVTINTPIIGSADLAISKVDAVDPVQAGSSLLYTITVQNRGPSAASNVVVTDTLPYGVTFDAANSSPGASEPVAGSIVFVATQDPFPAGATETFTLTVDVAPDLPIAFSLVNRAEVGSDTPDGNPDNNTAIEDTEVLATASLSVSKLSDPETVDAGTQLTYTIVVTNHGPAKATDVRVLDALPKGTSFVSATADNGGACNSGILCLLGTLDLHETATVEIVVDVDASLREGAVFTNTASAFSEQLDPHDPIHASVATTITEKVDVSVVKQDFPDPAGIGGTIRYELLVSNSGPSDAFDVIITDTLDANTTFVQATLGYNCVENPTGVIECSIPVLPAGESRTIALLVDIATVGLSDGDLLTNNVVVTSDSFDTDPGNNNDESTTTVRAGTDLSVGKVAAEQVIAGEYLTYTIKVNNLGPSLAANVVVTDILPPALVVSTVAFTPSVGTCNLVVNKVVCNLGAMSYPPQSTETITITGQVDPAAPLGQVLVNTAQVDSDTFDFHSFNNDTRFETLVVGRSDLGIVKSGPATATAGLDTITYSLVVTNEGPTQAQNVFVEDPLPPGLTLISVSSTKGTCAAGIACSIGSLSPFGVSGEEVTITVVASVDEDVPDGTLLENIATVSGSVVDDNPFNDQSQADTLISSAATLKISKIDLFDPVEPGGMIFYRIAVTNTGPSAAANVIVSDTLPPGVIFQSASLGCTHDGSATGGDVTCSASYSGGQQCPDPRDHRLCAQRCGQWHGAHQQCQRRCRQRRSRRHQRTNHHPAEIHAAGRPGSEQVGRCHRSGRWASHLHRGDHQPRAGRGHQS